MNEIVESDRGAADGTPQLAPIAVSVARFGELIGVSRATAWRLIQTRAIASFHVGARRVVPLEAVHAYVRQQLAAS
jgi:hypothetical protein